MKRKDADAVNGDFFDFTLSSPALKIRRLDTDLAPLIDEQETLKSDFVEQSMESSPITIDEVRSSVPVNEERAIVLFNPKNSTPMLQSPIPYSISTNSDFLSRFRNPVIWSDGSDTPKSLADETQNEDDNPGMINGCLAVVPWVPSHSQHPPDLEFEAPDAQRSDMRDSDAMDVEDDYNTQQAPKQHHVTTNVTQDWNQWQQHCMVQQPPNNFSTPVTWLGFSLVLMIKRFKNDSSFCQSFAYNSRKMNLILITCHRKIMRSCDRGVMGLSHENMLLQLCKL